MLSILMSITLFLFPDISYWFNYYSVRCAFS